MAPEIGADIAAAYSFVPQRMWRIGYRAGSFRCPAYLAFYSLSRPADCDCRLALLCRNPYTSCADTDRSAGAVGLPYMGRPKPAFPCSTSFDRQGSGYVYRHGGLADSAS